MKLIGKQIVVELPEKENGSGLADEQPFLFGKTVGYNQALSEVAKMNPALEVDEDELTRFFGVWIRNRIQANVPLDTRELARDFSSNLPKWLKVKLV